LGLFEKFARRMSVFTGHSAPSAVEANMNSRQILFVTELPAEEKPAPSKVKWFREIETERGN
jgi:hypothetical protein